MTTGLKVCLKSDTYLDFLDNHTKDSTPVWQHHMDSSSYSSKETPSLDLNGITSEAQGNSMENSKVSQVMDKDSSFILHLDPDPRNLKTTPSPSEASMNMDLPPSGLDLRQRLLELQARSATIESYHENPQWENSFPPTAYYITPPSYTPEERPTSSLAIFPHLTGPGQYFENSQLDTERQDNEQSFLPNSINIVPSPRMGDYHQPQVDSDHPDSALMDTQLSKEPPYAELLYKCLLEAPSNEMILKDIYEWFRTNTDKTNNPDVKGWMNSIRHNLSMNQGFEKVEQTFGEDGRRGYVWRLSEKALREGIQSTTRYRKKAPLGKYGGVKNRRNHILGANRVVKSRFHRSQNTQSELVDDGIGVEYRPDHQNVTDYEERGVSPESYVDISPPTSRGYVSLTSGTSTPLFSSMHSPSNKAYESFSSFSTAPDIPRSDPNNNTMRYSGLSASVNQLPYLSDFQSVVRAGRQSQNGLMSMFSGCQEQWDDYCPYADGSTASSDALQSFEQPYSSLGYSMFPMPHVDNCFVKLYTSVDDGAEMSTFVDN